MRVAISGESDNGLESATSVHLGRCPYFVLVDLERQEIKQVRTVANLYYDHHQPGQVPGFIVIVRQMVEIGVRPGKQSMRRFCFHASTVDPTPGGANSHYSTHSLSL